MSEARQLRHRMHAEFIRDAGSVKFDRSLVNTEVGGNLLVEAAAQDSPEHLAFAGAKGLKPLPHEVSSSEFGVFLLVPSQSAVHRRE